MIQFSTDSGLSRQTFTDLKYAVKFAPRTLRTIVNKSILPRSRARLLKVLATEAGPVSRPFEFATARSRAWYFANKKAPYRRTGRMIKSWKVMMRQFQGDAFGIVAENDAPGAQYVFGPRQVPGHFYTGWADADIAVNDEAARLDDEVITAALTVIDAGTLKRLGLGTAAAVLGRRAGL